MAGARRVGFPHFHTEREVDCFQWAQWEQGSQVRSTAKRVEYGSVASVGRHCNRRYTVLPFQITT